VRHDRHRSSHSALVREKLLIAMAHSSGQPGLVCRGSRHQSVTAWKVIALDITAARNAVRNGWRVATYTYANGRGGSPVNPNGWGPNGKSSDSSCWGVY